MIENQENGEHKMIEINKYRRKIVHAIREKVTRRENCTVHAPEELSFPRDGHI